MAILPRDDDEDVALSLTMAVIAASPTPLLLLDGEFRLVVASTSFCQSFGIDPGTATGCEVFMLGAGEWNVGSLRKLLVGIASGVAQIEPCEMDLKRSGKETRRLVVQVSQLVYEDLDHPRLLMAVADVTDARSGVRAKDEAIAHIGVLLQEVRHRVANSLQIVSAVLLQTARRTNSVETREQLKDAHNRVMSVAALERQLSASPYGDEIVELRTYFTTLCDNIAASLIDDSQCITLSVTGSGLVTPRVSVSLGLIVTELIINAVKHAFPHGRSGRIEIGYAASGPHWTLSVSDDGIGPPIDAGLDNTKLGTSIVRALAKQLDANVEVTLGNPGTIVRIECAKVALGGENDGFMPTAPSQEDGQTKQGDHVLERSNTNGHAARR